jgi:hypothetical protein
METERTYMEDGESYRETWHDSFPHRIYLYDRPLAFRALCPDGIYRRVDRLSEPDTYFSIPGSVKAHGLTVRGYVTGGTTINGKEGYLFRPYRYRKNFAAVYRPGEAPRPTDPDTGKEI